MEQHEIAMLGSVLAALTHDLRNVLGAVGESADLCRDLLTSAGTSGPVQGERLAPPLARVLRQVERGSGMVGSLNTLAHLMDEPCPRVAADVVLDQVAFLMGRTARLREVELVAAPAGSEIDLELEVPRLILALCAGVRFCLTGAPAGTRLTVAAGRLGGDVRFEIAVEGPAGDRGGTGDELAPWRATLAALGGRLEVAERDGRSALVFRVPAGGGRS